MSRSSAGSGLNHGAKSVRRYPKLLSLRARAVSVATSADPWWSEKQARMAAVVNNGPNNSESRGEKVLLDFSDLPGVGFDWLYR